MNEVEMKLSDCFIDCLEDQDWNILGCYEQDEKYGFEDDERYEIEIEFYSDLGEDFVMTILFDGTDRNFCENFRDYWRGFDPDDHAVMWYQCHGENGAPENLRELLDDAESIEKHIWETFLKLEKLLSEEGGE